jgi:hypothetical protein
MSLIFFSMQFDELDLFDCIIELHDWGGLVNLLNHVENRMF